jgi:phospholipid transport system substrate-binding protein
MPSRGKVWQSLMPVWGVLLALSLTLASGAQAGGPTAEVKTLIDEVLGILQHHPSQSPAQKHQRLQLIEKTAARRIDYREMAKRCLGPTWNTLSRAQQQEFVHLFSELLKSSYAGRLDEFAQARVDYQSEENSPDSAEVRILILRQNDRIPVTFRMLKEAQGWMIYDLVIEGVSLVNNYRSQFGRIINESSYQALVRSLQAKLQAESGCIKAEVRKDEKD